MSNLKNLERLSYSPRDPDNKGWAMTGFPSLPLPTTVCNQHCLMDLDVARKDWLEGVQLQKQEMQ